MRAWPILGGACKSLTPHAPHAAQQKTRGTHIGFTEPRRRRASLYRESFSRLVEAPKPYNGARRWQR
eukprot:CAMPEP_0198542680 /NCGR_PEP_ID=MMETSP1462-20131121/58362_1 /TAXON_ID=1333877 /ORGANISM="Brandtodinium nutriculum, Strain RCC3387" /LENGTH=66 /DNA_ID=CAMNT_0044272927 /DNA_START=87 /DNA_END=283 /DNA_ORIENTATION=+